MRMFTDIIREMRGNLNNELSEAISELVMAVDESGKPGKVTLVITIKPDKGGENILTTRADWESKLPKRDRPETVFFRDNAGNLTRTDPSQGDLAFTDVSSTRPKPVPGITGEQLRDVNIRQPS